jgi:hypothetical protein
VGLIKFKRAFRAFLHGLFQRHQAGVKNSSLKMEKDAAVTTVRCSFPQTDFNAKTVLRQTRTLSPLR